MRSVGPELYSGPVALRRFARGSRLAECNSARTKVRGMQNAECEMGDASAVHNASRIPHNGQKNAKCPLRLRVITHHGYRITGRRMQNVRCVSGP